MLKSTIAMGEKEEHGNKGNPILKQT